MSALTGNVFKGLSKLEQLYDLLKVEGNSLTLKSLLTDSKIVQLTPNVFESLPELLFLYGNYK